MLDRSTIPHCTDIKVLIRAQQAMDGLLEAPASLREQWESRRMDSKPREELWPIVSWHALLKGDNGAQLSQMLK